MNQYEYEGNDPFDPVENEVIGVTLVRANTGSRIAMNSQNAADIQSEKYAGNYGVNCLFYYCNNESTWQKFVWEFFPGWKIQQFYHDV